MPSKDFVRAASTTTTFAIPSTLKLSEINRHTSNNFESKLPDFHTTSNYKS